MKAPLGSLGVVFMTLGPVSAFTRAILRPSGQFALSTRLGFMPVRPLSSGASSAQPPAKRPRSSHVIVYGTPTLQDGNLRQCLADEVSSALTRAFGDAASGADPMVTDATRPEFGDYQCNAALALAKTLKSKPRDAAEKLMKELQVQEWCEAPEIAGPGFINVKLKPAFVESRLKAMLADEERLGVQRPVKPQRVVVDFSSPNIAKEMHVGHLRSTIIGDTISRVLEFLGHDVLRLNHVGDWGTQFGMLITHLKEKHPQVLATDGSGEAVDLGDLVEFYKEAKVRFDEDEEFKLKSRQEVVNLQSGTEVTLRAWRTLCQISRTAFQEIYDRLGVKLQERGESFYNPLLADVVKDLEGTGLLVKSEGARVVFLDGYQTREGQPQPFIVQKSDGGFLYATTDIAAARHRAKVEKADRVLYVTDAGQSSHFDQVFQVVRKAGFVPTDVELKHVPFGLVQGEDGKKFKTRAGDTVKLRDLLDEAVRIANEDLSKRYEESGDAPADLDRNAQVIGIGAVKYADLSLNRESDYRFSYKKMLALTGNTAPYMLYAYARIQSILRKSLGEDAGAKASLHDIKLVEVSEMNLGRQLVKFTEQLLKLEQDLYPHTLCEYIYDLSQKFNQFYESCPVNNAESEDVRKSRLALCLLTARVLRLSLNLLGIEVLEKM